MRKFAPILFAALFIAFCAVVRADGQTPFTITSGSLTINNTTLGSSGGQFTLNGPNTVLRGWVTNGNWTPGNCTPCLAGNSLSVNSLYSGESSIRPSKTIVNTFEEDGFSYSGTLSIIGEPITVPRRYSRLPFRISQRVTLNGFLTIWPTNNTGLPKYTSSFQLTGTVTLTLKFNGYWMGTPMYRVMSAMYEFPPPAGRTAE
jgi:hypothetical protein